MLATIRDGNGNILHLSDPEPGLNAEFDVNLSAGIYYLTVEGTDQSGLYNDYGSVGFYTIEGVAPIVTGLPIGESGRIQNLTERWHTVNLIKTYRDPVVVAGPSSRVGAAPLNVRVRNVTSTSFEVRIDEWDYLDGRHRNGETVDYMVMDAGEYTLQDGTVIMAGNRNLQNHRWSTNSLSDTFIDASDPPVILTQTVTENDPTAVTTRTRLVSTTEFQMRLQEEQAYGRGNHAFEKVSWIAIQQNVGHIGLLQFEAGRTGNHVTHTAYDLQFQSNFTASPAFLASMQTFNGGDTATVRYRSLTEDSATIYIEEERSLDREMAHNAESVGYLAIEIGEIRGVSAGRLVPNYYQWVGNLSDFRGNYPDYSDALKLVRAREADYHNHYLEHDAHHHDKFDSEHAAHQLANFVRLYSIPSTFDRGEPGSTTSELLDAVKLAELAGAIVDNVAELDLNHDGFKMSQHDAAEIEEIETLGFAADEN